MKLTQRREYQYTATSMTMSKNEETLAICAGSNIKVFSLPEMELEQTIRVKNPGCACFLGDNRSMLIINTTGGLYFWNGEKVRRVGKILGECYQGKMFYDCGKDVVVFTTGEEIYRFDAASLQCRKIYSESERKLAVISCKDGQILLLGSKVACDYQNLELITIDLEGHILKQVWTQKKIQTGIILYCQAMSPEGNIAVAAMENSCLFHADPINQLYLVGQDGSVVGPKRLPGGIMGAYNRITYAHGCFVLLNQLTVSYLGLTQIGFYDTKDLSLLYEFKMNEGEINPATDICFTNNGDVYVATYMRLYVLRMAP